MRTVSLEKQIAGIINDGQVLRSEEYRMYLRFASEDYR